MWRGSAWSSRVVTLLLLCGGTAMGEPLTLRLALLEARSQAPALAQARAQEAVARGDEEVARTFSPLTLTLGGGGNDPRWTVGLTQRLPAPGARAARVLAAELTARGAADERRASEATVRADARRAYFSCVRAHQLLETSARALALARESEAAALLLFDTGAAPELDLLQARIARGSAEVQWLTRQGELAAATAALALLLGRPPGAALEPVDASPPALPSLEAVLAQGARSPAAEARQADVAAAEASLRASRRERWPVPTVGVSVEADGPGGRSTYLRGALDLDLSLPGLGRGETVRAAASLELARARQNEERRSRWTELVSSHARLSASLAGLARYSEEILPAVEKTEGMALESYRVGRSSRVALNAALQTATETRTQAIEAAFAAQSAFADLELAAGMPLDEP
ncbi:TolC family protein [Corallococcus sp. AB011P]|uniref:TolC family protein n=1 Tax=Corallococcus sp. AB011P TaxID=2316735 RepID=UPI000EA070F5|nr:TolC family protein [Corallococcus sp. AB011P]RKG56465.1 TolC family protein [Corallococcus sp. AB011P]